MILRCTHNLKGSDKIIIESIIFVLIILEQMIFMLNFWTTISCFLLLALKPVINILRVVFILSFLELINQLLKNN